jgi:hypothetical protein
MALDEPSTGGQLIVNLRAETAPDDLVTALKSAVESVGGDFSELNATLDHEEHFRPGRPEPTHRDGEAPVIKGGCVPGSGCC